MSHPCVSELMTLFDDVFLPSFNTRLVHAESDPEYIPARDASDVHRIAFAHGFFTSALHEIAHWCIAGAERRKLPDFGYWYAPDGRSAAQQRQFYQVEIKPQALEWMFSVAAGIRFRVSTDNLSGDVAEDHIFEHSVHQQVARYLASSIPARAKLWCQTLAAHYDTGERWLDFQHYVLPERE